jgi:hypothetical protein
MENKMKTKVKIAMIAAVVLALPAIGCATSKTKKALDNKLSQEAQVQSPKVLQEEASSLVDKNPNLTTEQKTKLHDLREQTRQQMDEIQRDSLKLRAVLIQDVLAQKYNPVEVDLIKRRMAKLDSKRTSVIFDAVDKTNRILGRNLVDGRDLILMHMINADNGQLREEF